MSSGGTLTSPGYLTWIFLEPLPLSSLVALPFALRVDRLFYVNGNLFQVIEAHVRVARKLDQLGPDTFTIGKLIPNTFVEVGQEVNRYITPLNFVTGATEGFDHT
jgi:hypothetical protein